MRKWFQYLFAVIGGILGLEWSTSVGQPFFNTIERVIGVQVVGQNYWMMLAGFLIFYGASAWVADYGLKLVQLGEERITRVPMTDLFAGTLGMSIGLLLTLILLT